VVFTDQGTVDAAVPSRSSTCSQSHPLLLLVGCEQLVTPGLAECREYVRSDGSPVQFSGLGLRIGGNEPPRSRSITPKTIVIGCNREPQRKAGAGSIVKRASCWPAHLHGPFNPGPPPIAPPGTARLGGGDLASRLHRAQPENSSLARGRAAPDLDACSSLRRLFTEDTSQFSSSRFDRTHLSFQSPQQSRALIELQESRQRHWPWGELVPNNSWNTRPLVRDAGLTDKTKIDGPPRNQTNRRS
jgi:hypothetical protein